MQLRSGDYPDDGIVPNTDMMVKEVYRMLGWDEKGVPKPETLKNLGLDR